MKRSDSLLNLPFFFFLKSIIRDFPYADIVYFLIGNKADSRNIMVVLNKIVSR